MSPRDTGKAAPPYEAQLEAVLESVTDVFYALDKDQQVAVWLSEEFAAARRRFAGKG